MVLVINTSDSYDLEVKLHQKGKILSQEKVSCQYQQSEKLLATIDRVITTSSISLKDLQEIRVVAEGDSFTGLRIGVVTANALGYGLGVPVKAVDKKERPRPAWLVDKKGFGLAIPQYDKSPNITIKKQ